MDFKEQQEQEIEALESIFSQEFTLNKKDPYASFTFNLKTNDNDENEVATLTITFTYTPKYPDEAPEFEIEDSQNVNDDIENFIKDMATQNLGMPMIYTIVAGLLEKIQVDNESRLREVEEARERAERAREEEEVRKFEGTKVTVESFLRWKAKFDAEQVTLKKQHIVDITQKKLSGKQLFERDMTLADSDLQLLDDGDNVEVDEALFQDMEDLDLVDEDDNGEEWKPDNEEEDEEDDD